MLRSEPNFAADTSVIAGLIEMRGGFAGSVESVGGSRCAVCNSPKEKAPDTCQSGTTLLFVTVNEADSEFSGSTGSDGVTTGRGYTTATTPIIVVAIPSIHDIALRARIPVWCPDVLCGTDAEPLTGFPSEP